MSESDHRPTPDDVERSLLVRQPYARQLVRGLKLVEMRKVRHNRVGEVVGIIELPDTPRPAALFVGVIELGRVRWVPKSDYRLIAEQACTTVATLNRYARGRDGLWAWEVWNSQPTEPAVAVPLKSGHQTWVRHEPPHPQVDIAVTDLRLNMNDMVVQAEDTVKRLTRYIFD